MSFRCLSKSYQDYLSRVDNVSWSPDLGYYCAVVGRLVDSILSISRPVCNNTCTQRVSSETSCLVQKTGVGRFAAYTEKSGMENGSVFHEISKCDYGTDFLCFCSMDEALPALLLLFCFLNTCSSNCGKKPRPIPFM